MENNQFTQTESQDWNLMWANSTCKSFVYENLNEYQKVNHFPCNFEITRKDRLCANYVSMQEKYGKTNFDFLPDTYILPNEFGEFHAHYQRLK